jgi:hypothetical protein
VHLPQTVDEIDSYLFGQGLAVNDYFIEGEVIGFMQDGRSFDLIIDHDELHDACMDRLMVLGVEQRPVS